MNETEIDDRSNEESGRSVVTGFLALALNLYFITVMLAIPYFNFRYAKEHGFMNWLLLGEIVPTVQAVLWPYYALNAKPRISLSDAEKNNLEHYHRSSDAVRQAQEILNLGPPDRISELKPEEAAAYVSLYKIALNEARLVDLDVLAKIHPDFPMHYSDEYLASIQLLHRSHTDDGTFNDQRESHEKWDQWVDWFNANKQDLRMPKRLGR